MRKKRKAENAEKDRWHKGIYILPNSFTTMNLFCGFTSIIASMEGNFNRSALLILGGMVFDVLDGKVARATRTTSRFGIEYDSLADLISFGLAPGLLMYLWALKPLGKLGWIAALIFLACGALRLARFNTTAGTTDNRWFTGLPIPAAAGMVATTILLFNRIGMKAPDSVMLYVMLACLYVLSFLMVSSIKYVSFKKLPPVLVHAKNFNLLVFAVLLLVFIVQEPTVAVFTIGLLYIVSGPVSAFRRHSSEEESLNDLAEHPETGPSGTDQQSTPYI